MSGTPTIVLASLSDDKLKESINSLVKHVNDKMEEMVESTNSAVKRMEAKLKSLGNLKIDSNGSADGGASKRAKAQNAEIAALEKSNQAAKEKTMTLDQQASAINTAVQSEKKYTDEVLRQAAAIRSSKEWQEKGHVVVDDVNYYDKERANVSKRDKQLLLSLEEQIVQAQQKEAQEALVAAEAKRQQAQAAKEAAQAPKGVSSYDLGIDPNISVGRQRQIESTRAASKETEYLKQQVASLLEVEEREIKTANTTSSSYAQLAQYLKNLQSAYQRLGADRIAKGEGADLAKEIQNTQRAMQKLQQTMSRPVSLKDALGGSEKTLDDIAYKMQRLRAYKQGIDLMNPNAANEIKQVDEALTRLQKDANKWMSKSNDMIKSNTALGRSWNYMKNRLAFYFTVGASTSFIKNLIEVRSQYEMNERALGILINSAERGTQIFNELSQMALVSPYTLIELSTAAKQLTAYDVAAKDVVDTTRRLADMAAAVGIPIERLTYALGQIKAYGYLNSRDARMFANAGIPLVKQLSDYYTELEGKLVSTADVYDRIKKKAIDYNEVMEVINKMTDQGGKFFDFQAKMADTLKVRLANLTLAWNNMLNDMGKESQGVLTWGIGALRYLFLQWKQLNNLIENAALAVGVRTLLVALRAATIGLGSFGKAMTWNAILGKKLGGVVVGLAKSFGTLFSSRLTWFALLAIAAVEATQAIFGVNEAQKALNESIRNGAKDNYDNISKFLEQYKEVRDSLYSTKKVAIGSIYNPTTRKAEATAYAEQQVGQDIDQNEAKKAWEAVREQIELTVVSSDKYIGNLLSISNMSERVRQGFNLLDDVQVVNAALKELDDDTIIVSKDLSAWWNAWQAPDGLIGNLKDYQETLNDIIAEYGTLESFRENTFLGGKGSDDLNDYETALERFRDDLQKTTDSIINFIELKGWSGDESKINQVFEQITQKLVLDNQLDPQKAFTLQTEVEEARSNAAKQALLQRINDEKEAYKISRDEQLRQSINADVARYNSWNETNGRSKVEWERFTKWLKEQHISETTAMFRNMDAEDIKSLNFQEGKHAEWVTKMVTQYAKEHKMSIDDVERYLKNFVRNANRMSIFIPLTISTEDKKSVYDQLGEYDKAVDEADAQIERLTKRINELNAKKKKSKEETRELANAEQELADAQKAKADAEAKGGHGKKEKKDERAANKAAKQAESELQKTLKDEITLLDKVRSTYKTLTKDGISSTEALDIATSGYEETLASINARLSKFGLKTLDITKYAGVSNPRAVMDMLQEQLNTLLRLGAAKPSEIKDLQVKLKDLQVDSVTFDQKTLINSLNNELSKIKDEYELAVELDANPELGDMFADMFGINTSTLPKTFGDALDRAQTIINRKLAEMNITTPFDLMEGNIDDFAKSTGRDRDSAVIKELIAAQNSYRDMFKKNITETEKVLDDYIKKYGDYSDKIAEIEASRLEKLKKLNEAYYTEEMRKRPEYVAKLNAIEQGASKEKQQVDFEEFKNSRYYTMMFENLDYISTKTIRDMRDRVRELMDTMNDLTPEQLKTLISQYEKLEQKLVKRSPFKTLTKDLKEYLSTSKERKAANQEFKNAQKEYDTQKKNVAALKEKYEQAKANSNTSKSYLDFLQIEIGGENEILQILKQQLDAAQEKADKYNLTAKLAKSEALAVAQVVGQNLQSLGELRDFLQQDLGVELSDELNGLVDGLSKVGQGINKITSSATSGDVVGVITGVGQTIYGLYDGIASIFGGGSAKDNKIVRQIEESEKAVKRLELAYIDLEHAIGEAYGSSVVGAKRILAVTKELELAELERQLALEQSRKKKDRDADKILDLQKRIKELRYEISDSIREITDDLLGSDVGSFAENLVSEMAEAFKSGEDYMKVFNEKFDNMIDNMIIKSIVSKVVSQRINAIWDSMDAAIKERSQTESDNYAEAIKKREEFESKGFAGWFRETTGLIVKDVKKFTSDGWGKKMYNTYNNLLDTLKVAEQEAKDAYDAATQIGDSDINALIKQVTDIKPELAEKLKEALGLYWKFGEDSSESQLSALQQGIQGVTEDTAGAIEAYMNGVSQQVYLHSDLLTQIRDTIIGFNMDIQLGTLSEILLQLQNSYMIMQTMSQMMSNWTTNTGNGIRVELVS